MAAASRGVAFPAAVMAEAAAAERAVWVAPGALAAGTSRILLRAVSVGQDCVEELFKLERPNIVAGSLLDYQAPPGREDCLIKGVLYVADLRRSAPTDSLVFPQIQTKDDFLIVHLARALEAVALVERDG
jgi:hypothetical protein